MLPCVKREPAEYDFFTLHLECRQCRDMTRKKSTGIPKSNENP